MRKRRLSVAELVVLVGLLFIGSMMALALTYSSLTPKYNQATGTKTQTNSVEVNNEFIKAKGEFNCDKTMITAKELREHDKCSLIDVDDNDFWMTINGKVYDLSLWSALGFSIENEIQN